ncbi:MAG TPA: CHASE3 domain-containing protein [Rhizobiaceae bacterium]|nr:CHASE3 domain-containing protein [Rhizobiaceae bacterium]
MLETVRRFLRMQLLPLVLIFAILALLVAARTVLIETQRTNNAAVQATFELDRRVVQVLSLLQDAEIGQRGYLLTSEQQYRAPYDSAVTALPAEIQGIRDLIQREPGRLPRFPELVSASEEKLAELKETIDMFASGNRSGALEILRSDRGKVLMDRVRSIVADIRRDENAMLVASLDEADELGEWLRIASIASALAILALALFGFLAMRRRMREVMTAHAELAAANVALTDEIRTRETAESQVRQMQKMEAVGQLTGGIAHDFNNMLAVIVSAMNLIQRKLARGENDIGKFVDSAMDAAQRAASLTGRLLAFARQQPLAPQVIETNRLVADMSDMLRRTLGESIHVETVLAGGLWKTRADPGQVENAILNLAVNARDAMGDGGRLTIETANAYLDDAYAASHTEVPAGQYVMIAVTDTGAGMAPDVAARAFEPFFTTKPISKGTGLGLSQVFGFVKQTGGHVKIYSEIGSGTTLKIYLPRYFGEDVQPVEAVPVKAQVAPTETVLVVEDDERVRAGTVDTLRELGYVVIHAGGGDEALRLLSQTPGVALLFTDIVMPDMNGRKLADEARTRHPALKVLYTTGFTRNAVVHNGVLDHGVNFIAKPFTIDQLSQKLREVLEIPA